LRAPCKGHRGMRARLGGPDAKSLASLLLGGGERSFCHLQIIGLVWLVLSTPPREL
jgi:hypothetical protein